MRKLRQVAWLSTVVTSMAAFVPTARGAETPVPTADKPGSADNPLLKRYQGSLIVYSERKNYDEFTMPLSKVEAVEGKRDAHNNQPSAAKKSKTLEGRYTHLLYLVPPERSPLEVLRNYQEYMRAKGGKILYECKDADCGDDPRGNVFGVGTWVSLAKFLYSQDRVTEPYASPGFCAMQAGIADSRYTAVELAGGKGYVSVFAYTTPVPAIGECKAFTGRTYVAVDLVEGKAREQKMVSVNAADMAEAITSGGKVALYGIYFDTAKAEVQPASDETLEQIGKLLKSKSGLKLLVVGHTDNAGTFAANMDLSQRRAAAVVNVLATRYGVKKDRLTPVGVASAAPVASNKTDEGRAKNRRVELVEN